MTQDVPSKSHDSADMHQIEQVHELMEFQQEIEGLLDYDLEENEEGSSTEVVHTVATNTTQ